MFYISHSLGLINILICILYDYSLIYYRYDVQENPLNPGDPGHLVFYSLMQSICYILCFTSKRFEQEVGKSPENAKTLFRILQKIFEKCIMLTHRSKYTQFLLFYICHFDPMFVER